MQTTEKHTKQSKYNNNQKKSSHILKFSIYMQSCGLKMHFVPIVCIESMICWIFFINAQTYNSIFLIKYRHVTNVEWYIFF